MFSQVPFVFERLVLPFLNGRWENWRGKRWRRTEETSMKWSVELVTFGIWMMFSPQVNYFVVRLNKVLVDVFLSSCISEFGGVRKCPSWKNTYACARVWYFEKCFIKIDRISSLFSLTSCQATWSRTNNRIKTTVISRKLEKRVEIMRLWCVGTECYWSVFKMSSSLSKILDVLAVTLDSILNEHHWVLMQ